MWGGALRPSSRALLLVAVGARIFAPFERSAGEGLGVPTGTLSHDGRWRSAQLSYASGLGLRGHQLLGPLPPRVHASRHAAALSTSRRSTSSRHPVRAPARRSCGHPRHAQGPPVGQMVYRRVLRRGRQGGRRRAPSRRIDNNLPLDVRRIRALRWNATMTPVSTLKVTDRLVAGGGARAFWSAARARLRPRWRGPRDPRPALISV